MSTPRSLLTIALCVLLVRPVLTSAAAAADRTYAGSGNATLEVGGEATPLLSAEGGAVVGIVTTAGTGATPDKRITNVKVEDIVVSLPATNSPKFVADALQGKAPLASGAVTFAGADQKVTRRLSFKDAQISAITWPALDGSSKEAAVMHLAITPSSIKEDAGGGQAQGKVGAKQKQALASNFRVEIPGLPTNRIATVAPIEIRALVTGGADAGDGRKPQAAVGGYDVSNIKLTVSAADIADWRKWHDDSVVQGNAQEKTMRVILLGPNMKDEIVSLDLSGVGIVAVRPDAAVANSEKIARVEVELYAETAKITPLGDGAKTASAAPAEQPPAETAPVAEPAKPQPAAVPERPIRRAR